jgi:hypothetical protein
MRSRRAVVIVTAGIASIVGMSQLGLIGGGAAAQAPAKAAKPPAFRFTPGLALLDNNGATTGAAEPTIKVDSLGHIYVTGPEGVPNGGCPLWYVHPDTLNAQGLPYEYRGKFDNIAGNQAFGGGDCDLATGGAAPANGFDNLAASSLTLSNLTVNQSSDGGATFQTPANPFGQQVFGDDRQWNAADTPLGRVYMTVHDVATDNIQISVSTDGGYTYVSNNPAISAVPGTCGETAPDSCLGAATMDNHFGNIVVNPTTHMLYTVYVAPANAAENAAAQSGSNLNEHVVYVAVGDPCATVACTPGGVPGPITWTDYPVYSAPTGTDLAHIFPSIGIDAGGTVYVTFSDTLKISLMRSITPDTGAGWTVPVTVKGSDTAHSSMFPWVVGGRAGVADLVWYDAFLPTPQHPGTASSNHACDSGTEPTDDSQGVNNNCHNQWDVDFSQATFGSAANAVPAFKASDAGYKAVHYGSLCDQGLTCTTGAGDRTLLDFFQIALDPQGGANIAYADDASHPGTADIIYTRQCKGPSAISTSPISNSCGALIPPPPPLPTKTCAGTHVVKDASGDAVNPSGAPGDTSQADITNVAFSTDSVAHTLTTTMTLASLTSPPQPLAGTSDTYYYVVWSFGGNTYATLASEPQPDATAYSYGPFDPTTNQLTTANAATGSVTAGTPGTISVTVPLSGIGNPTIPSSTIASAAAQTPYALTISGEGAVGTGLVFTHPDDRGPNSGFGPAWSVC